MGTTSPRPSGQCPIEEFMSPAKEFEVKKRGSSGHDGQKTKSINLRMNIDLARALTWHNVFSINLRMHRNTLCSTEPVNVIGSAFKLVAQVQRCQAQFPKADCTKICRTILTGEIPTTSSILTHAAPQMLNILLHMSPAPTHTVAKGLLQEPI